MFYLDYVNTKEKYTETTDYCHISKLLAAYTGTFLCVLRYKQQDLKKGYTNKLLLPPSPVGARRLVCPTHIQRKTQF